MSGNYISKIPVLVVALVIGIVLVTSAVVPLASDYSEAKTFKNEGYFYVNKVTEGTTTISFDYTNPNVLTVNDKAYSFNGMPSDITVALTDNTFLRFQPGTRLTLVASDRNYAAGTATSKNLSITATDGTMTVNLTGSDPATIAYTDLYVISDSGEYVMKKSNESVYILSDTVFFGAGRSTIGTSDTEFLKFTGTIDDGVTISTLRGSENTFTTPIINNSEVASYVDLYQLSSITTTATNETGSSDLTYSYFIVPAEVTADPDNPAAYKNLVKIVPLMAFIMLVVAAAGMVYFKNRD